jgi:hypothetical protein
MIMVWMRRPWGKVKNLNLLKISWQFKQPTVWLKGSAENVVKNGIKATLVQLLFN